MSEWEEKLNTLLSDPDAMAQVMQMAQSLSQQMGASGGAGIPLRAVRLRRRMFRRRRSFPRSLAASTLRSSKDSCRCSPR